jgi:ATP-dependent Lhr-like helicase
VKDLRACLPRTWYAFLARHPRPRPIQVLAARPILEGKAVLLASATASGKTEAYVAPLVELWLEDMRAGVTRILVVSPTRALVNDLARRLETPLRRCGVRAQRRTGDHPRPLEGSRAGILLTTPESLDSLLSRHARNLGAVRAVVLDELHVLEGNARGDQLRVLLERLERVVQALGGPAPQRLAATATLGRASEVAQQFLGAGAVLAQIESPRDIQMHIRTVETPGLLQSSLLQACLELSARKVLAFVPSRADAEDLAVVLAGRPPFHSAVKVHHGSLSRQEREHVEQTLLRAEAALCLTTPTLEVGIDVGDVDLVALLGPPPDVTSFLQRIGRGNRRSGACQVLALARSVGEAARFAHLAECARAGRLLPQVRPFRSSVLVQQAFSLLFQNPRRFVSGAALSGRLPPGLVRRFGPERCDELLAHLCDEEWLVPVATGRFGPSPRLLQFFERGKIHHNLDAEGSEEDRVEVVDEQTGRLLGHVYRDAQGNLPEEISLGGHRRRIVADHGRQIRSRATGKGRAEFRSRGSAEVSAELAADLARYLGVDPRHLPTVRKDGSLLVGHFLGSARARLLREALRDAVGTGAGAGPFLAWLPISADWPGNLDTASLRRLLASRRRRLGRSLGAGPWASALPGDWLLEDLEAMADPQGTAQSLAGRVLTPAEPHLAEILVGLLPSWKSKSAL